MRLIEQCKTEFFSPRIILPRSVRCRPVSRHSFEFVRMPHSRASPPFAPHFLRRSIRRAFTPRIWTWNSQTKRLSAVHTYTCKWTEHTPCMYKNSKTSLNFVMIQYDLMCTLKYSVFWLMAGLLILFSHFYLISILIWFQSDSWPQLDSHLIPSLTPT